MLCYFDRIDVKYFIFILPFGFPVVPDVYTKIQHSLIAIFLCRLSISVSSLFSFPILITSCQLITSLEFSEILPSYTIMHFKCGSWFLYGSIAFAIFSSSTTKIFAMQSSRINLLVSALFVGYNPAH